MKNNGKKLGLGGTLVVIVLYLILQGTGMIGSQGDSETTGNNGVAQQTTQLPTVTEALEDADAPEVTEAPESTDAPEVTEAPEDADAPGVTEEPESADTPITTEAPETTQAPQVTEAPEEIRLTDYGFRNQRLQDSHFEKHGIEMGFETVEDYIEAANRVISNPDALHKLEAEDNDHIYFIEETNEFVVLSQDGYIRTYYIANGGIDYFNRQ